MKFEELYAQEWDAFLKEILEDIVAFAAQAHNRETIIHKLKKANYTEDQIKLGFKCYEEKYSVNSGGAVLRGKTAKDRLNWYSPVTDPDPNSRWGKLKKVLQGKGWADDHIDDLDSQSNTVVSNLASPKKADPSAVKGLVLGYVQSGKTANFSAVIAKATDEGYRLVIVLSGIHNGLRSQTEKRLRSELTDPFGGSNSFNLTTSDPSGDFKAENSVTPNALFDVSGKFTLAVLKKNSTVLSKFTKWMSSASPEVLRQCPVLVIDDEADQAGVNEGKGPENRTAINRRIVELIEMLRKHTTVSYCGYTATPFANVLIDAKDDADLFPRDFIVSLKAPDSYVGPERLFGRAAVDDDGGSPGINLVRHIDVSEAIDTDDAKVGKDLKPSLKRAIESFLLVSAERIRRGHQDKHLTMLVHTSHLTAIHQEMCQKIELYLKQLRVHIEENDSAVMRTLEELWNSDFRKTTAKDFPKQEIGTFDEIVDCLKVFVDKVFVIEENNKSETRLNFEPAKVWAIIVGGNTLSRGLTIEGLTVSYFHRTSTGYDTLLQMGRWFGYRNGYLDLTRIYVTPEMESNFYHLATVEHELREDIYRMEQNGETPLDIALKIRDHDDLEITGKRVLKKNGVFASNTYSASKIQASHLFVDDQATADKNFQAVKSLLKTLEDSHLKVPNEFEKFRRCQMYRGVDHKTVLKFLDQYSFSKADKKFNFGLLYSYINSLATNGELNDWSVAMMSSNQADDRKLVDMETNGIKVYAVERRQSDQVSRTPKELGSVLRYITVLRDELIDMGDVIPRNEMTDFLKDEKISQAISQRRNLRPSDRGLVLIYPIHTNWHLSQVQRDELREGRKFHPVISDIKKLFGICLVFPPTHLEHFDVNYIANASVISTTTKGKPAA
jgi:hypothetical protein